MPTKKWDHWIPPCTSASSRQYIRRINCSLWKRLELTVLSVRILSMEELRGYTSFGIVSVMSRSEDPSLHTHCRLLSPQRLSNSNKCLTCSSRLFACDKEPPFDCAVCYLFRNWRVIAVETSNHQSTCPEWEDKETIVQRQVDSAKTGSSATDQTCYGQSKYCFSIRITYKYKTSVRSSSAVFTLRLQFAKNLSLNSIARYYSDTVLQLPKIFGNAQQKGSESERDFF